MNRQGSSLEEQVWQLVAAVPAGRVAAYGQIARLAGFPAHARQVGSILARLPAGSMLPWFRIVRSNGELAFPPGTANWKRQQQQLGNEGITLKNHKVPMRRFQWDV